MQTFATEKIRNVVLLSHTGAGKTTLSEAMLFASGAISRIGKVEDGNTTSDYEPEEAKRRGSVQLSVLPCLWRDHKVNVLDTPGYFDFAGDAISAIRVADAAILVVAANAGVEVGTEQAWNRAQAAGIPLLFFVNKMDRENADFPQVVRRLEQAFGRQCVPLQVPLGVAQGFRGIVGLVPAPQAAPEEFKDQIQQARDRLAEAVAEADEELATKYLEGEPLTDEELMRALKGVVATRKLMPILAGSAVQGAGVKEMLDAILELLPSPMELPPAEAMSPGNKAPEPVKAQGNASMAALVFKTTADQYVGKLSLFRVYQGTFSSNSEVFNARKGQSERVSQLFVPRGKSQEPVPWIAAGDIGAVAKLAVTGTNDTLCQRDRPLLLSPIGFPTPLYTQAVYPKTKADTDKLGTALNRLVEEDPTVSFVREPDTGEALLVGLGDAHLDVALQRAQRKFGVNLLLQPPKVPFKETITAPTQVEHRHRQQSGGHGHYAHVFLRLEPLARGHGIEFGLEVVGGAVPKEFFAPVEKGVRRACAEGAIAGYPLVDMRVVLYDGSSHPVDSAAIDFETAGFFGLKKGVQQDGPVLLEPVMLVKVMAPDSATGDVIGDLNSKRARILGMTPQGNGFSIVEAHVPLMEVQTYALSLRSLTQARGTFSIAFDHYQEIPPHLAQRVVEQSKRAKEAP
ncbi:MAG: elongation factor G [Chloroflexi bacterium]|nr:elongation factor G [Chloroflexota bacterium]